MGASTEPNDLGQQEPRPGAPAKDAFEGAVARAASAVQAAGESKSSQWRVWMATSHLLLDTPEKAIDFGEAVVRAAYGGDQVEAERPFVAEDLGGDWRVSGTREGGHAIPFFAVSSTVTLSKKTGAIVDYRLSMPGPDHAEQPDK